MIDVHWVVIVGGAIWAVWLERRVRNLQERERLIHQLQFEREFVAYGELWSQSLELVNASLRLDPEIDHHIPHESEEERRKRKLDAYFNAIEQYSRLFRHHRPFIATSVFETARKLEAFCRSRQREYIRRRDDLLPADPDYWDKMIANANNIDDCATELCDSIRSKIWTK